MRLRRRERILAGVFGVALVGLAIDRMLLSGAGPQEAFAAQGDAQLGDVPLPPPIAPGTASAPDAAPPPAVKDVFSWARLGRNAKSARMPTGSAESAEMALSRFEANYALEAVILGPRPAALIGGVMLHVGDRLDGFELRELGIGGALFASEFGDVRLKLPRPGTPR